MVLICNAAKFCNPSYFDGRICPERGYAHDLVVDRDRMGHCICRISRPALTGRVEKQKGRVKKIKCSLPKVVRDFFISLVYLEGSISSIATVSLSLAND